MPMETDSSDGKDSMLARRGADADNMTMMTMSVVILPAIDSGSQVSLGGLRSNSLFVFNLCSRPILGILGSAL